MRTTTDVYSHVLPALAREAADQMGRVLWDNPSADLAGKNGNQNGTTDATEALPD
jgi:hypothetical protein